LIFSALASSSIEPYSPPSSMPCQRWARAKAFTTVPSTRAGLGAQADSPSCETTILRPRRLRKVSGAHTITLCPSQATADPGSIAARAAFARCQFDEES
jgi:hypothetical protein